MPATSQSFELSPPERPWSAYLWMLLGAAAFSVMGAFAHALGQRVDWKLVALVRSLLAGLFAFVLARQAGAQLVFLRPPVLWLRSLAGSVSLIATFYALAHLPIGHVLTLTNFFPVWVALLCWPLLGVRPTLGTWLAIGIGILGVVLVQQPHLAESNWAALVALFGSLFTAVAMLGLHQLHGIDPRAIVLHFSLVAGSCCALAIAFAGLHSATWSVINSELLLEFLGLGAAATVGQLFLTKAFAAGPPAKVSVVALSQVGFGALLDALVWHRSLNLSAIVGMLLVVAPTAWLLTRRQVVA